MATKGTYTRLLIDEFDLSCQSSSLEVSGQAAALNSTTFCATGETFEPGLPTGAITHSGYFTGAGTGYMEDVLNDRLGTGTPVYAAGLLLTNATNVPAYVCSATWGDQMNIKSPVAGLITVDGSWPATNGLVRGYVIQDGAMSATGAGTAYDFGAAGSAGGKGYLLVSAISGTASSATIDIESSATEGGTYASEGTFTLSALGVQTLDLSGTVNRWIRINVTSLGGATSITAVAICAVSGVTY